MDRAPALPTAPPPSLSVPRQASVSSEQRIGWLNEDLVYTGWCYAYLCSSSATTIPETSGDLEAFHASADPKRDSSTRRWGAGWKFDLNLPTFFSLLRLELHREGRRLTEQI